MKNGLRVIAALYMYGKRYPVNCLIRLGYTPEYVTDTGTREISLSIWNELEKNHLDNVVGEVDVMVFSYDEYLEVRKQLPTLKQFIKAAEVYLGKPIVKPENMAA